jgi:N-acetylglucosamine-6-phosphate deacetylase
VRAKGPGRWILVTDSVGWRGSEARVAGQEVRIVDGAPRLADGTIAGSALTMDVAVRNLVEACGIPLVDAVRAATETPAALVRRTDRGRLAPGCLADLVALTPQLAVEAVWVGGEQVR